MNMIIKAIILLLMGSLLSACTQLIFQPHKNHAFDIEKTEVNYQNVNFLSVDGVDLHGWWLPHTDSKYRSTLVFLHGNAGNITYHLANAYWLTRYGFDVLLFDYRGFGLSGGKPEIAGLMADITAAIDYAYRRGNQKKIVVIGQSLGASMGIYALSKKMNKDKVSAFAGISGFSDYQQIARDVLSNWWLTWPLQWPLSLTVNNDYRPLDYIAQVSPVPLLIMHSQADEIIPFYHAGLLFEAAALPKTMHMMSGLHNQTFKIDENRRSLLNYLMKVLPSK
ncbi:MAG: alpha/beta hydrolase [Gammaproteobacteria bacterium]|nr:alpha/beta hydrolase [Gammaproteobacteria bacterium]